MSRLLGLLLAALLSTAPASAGSFANLFVRYDVDSTTTTYCRYLGSNADPRQGAYFGTGTITTSGSSTTVTTVGSSGAFSVLTAGDAISVYVSATSTLIRNVVSKSDSDTIVVDTAVDLSAGYRWNYMVSSCGTADTDGWVSMDGFKSFTMTASYDQGDLGTGVDVVFECRGPHPFGAPVQVYPSSGATSLTTANAGTKSARQSVVAYEPWSECRIGVARSGADTSEATTSLELFSAYIEGRN